MPDVVLRHPKLKGQPIVVSVPVGAYVDRSYADAGWEIDTETSPVDAEAESAATAEAAQAKADKAAEKFVPEFAPAESADSTGGSASTTTTTAPKE
jgi:hypothetical protein